MEKLKNDFKLSFRTNEMVNQKVEKFAFETKRSKSQAMVFIIEDYLEIIKRKNKSQQKIFDN